MKPLEDYIAFGPISIRTVEELIHRRAYIVQDGKRRPLSDNVTVEDALGELGIVCLADLAHEIFNLGPNFDACLRMLAPFSLSAPRGGFEKKTLRLAADERRYLGEKFEEFIAKML